MHSFLPFALALAVLMLSASGHADVAYRFDITSAYATVDPFPNRIDTSVAGDDTGYVRIVNAGTSDYRGIIRLIAVAPFGIDMGFSLANGIIPAGGSVSMAIANDASDVGGFNGPAGTFRPGAVVYLEGLVTAGNESGPLKIAIQDLDLHSGVFRTDPYGLRTDNFVLQGGDPFGFDTGDDFELGQAWGHATLAGVVVPEPNAALLFAPALAALFLARARRASRPRQPPWQTHWQTYWQTYWQTPWQNRRTGAYTRR